MASITKSKAARPTSAERRTLILQTAAELFFEHGFSATSIDMIIDRIGGSKRTIYKEFSNKEALFAALVTELADTALSSAESIEGRIAQDMPSELIRLARNLMTIYTSKNLIGVYRAIVTESYRFPHLARAFYDKGPGRAAQEVRTILDAAIARGEVRTIDTSAAADHFVGMVRDNLHLQIVLGLRGPPGKDELQRKVSSVVDVFLSGIAERSSASR